MLTTRRRIAEPEPPSRPPRLLDRVRSAIRLRHLSPATERAYVAWTAGTPWLMASLLYGSGLRLMECARRRVKDLDLERREILVPPSSRRATTSGPSKSFSAIAT